MLYRLLTIGLALTAVRSFNPVAPTTRPFEAAQQLFQRHQIVFTEQFP